MKKTKLSVEIHASGSLNDGIIRMITNHNEGKVNVTLHLIQCYCKAMYAMYPLSTPEVHLLENAGEHTLHISENDKPTLTITEKQYIGELSETESNLVNQQNLS